DEKNEVDDDDGEENQDGDTTEATSDLSSEADSDASSTFLSETSTAAARRKKRNDPSVFATSISKILSSKLSTSKRADPVLSRSKSATDASRALADSKLDAKARAKLRAEKREALNKGRVTDVLGTENVETSTAEIVELEKRLRKTAQRGVVKLFNAVRAAQVKGEEAQREVRRAGVVGMANREEKVNEMSKQGFLELLTGSG
ncbi:Rrp15p-domain-containing protein, partial [Aulographum hederae CBS 113979]